MVALAEILFSRTLWTATFQFREANQLLPFFHLAETAGNKNIQAKTLQTTSANIWKSCKGLSLELILIVAGLGTSFTVPRAWRSENYATRSMSGYKYENNLRSFQQNSCYQNATGRGPQTATIVFDVTCGIGDFRVHVFFLTSPKNLP